VDDENLALKTALLKVAETGLAQFRFTPNQNLILSDIDESDKDKIEGILNHFGIIEHTNNSSLVRKNSIACVAFNTCPLALAEAQRYLPTLITKIEPLLKKHSLESEEISLRMTGCPNGCGRSPLAEIGFIGTAYGRYNLYLGGDRLGARLNQKFRDNLDEQEILTTLDEVFSDYSLNRSSGETLGDFAWRKYFEQQ
jgi:sulfite reductase (NADPH) hemoprotein beta-component